LKLVPCDSGHPIIETKKPALYGAGFFGNRENSLKATPQRADNSNEKAHPEGRVFRGFHGLNINKKSQVGKSGPFWEKSEGIHVPNIRRTGSPPPRG
jgi:hypothetical protein